VPRRLFLFIALLGLTSLSCSLLQGPQQPVIPTPPALPAAVELPPAASLVEGVLPGNLIFDPVSSVAPAVDPFVADLVNSVSQQQLVGYVQTLESFGTRSTFSATDRPDFGIGAARLWIFNEFLRVGNGRLQVEFDTFPLTLGGITTQQQNVIATLRGDGSAPGAILVIAHYDSRPLNPNDGTSRAPGANDNGSGVAAMLEVARVLSSQTWHQDVIFIAFAAEEQGTYGSLHYVNNRLFGGPETLLVLNNDIVGGRPGIPQSVRVFSPGPDSSLPRQMARYVNFIGGLYLPTFGVTLVDAVDREGRFSDHMRFLEAGIPALRLTESEEDAARNHTALDTSDALDYTYLRQVTQLNVATLANIIGAPARPEPPGMTRLEGGSDLVLTWPVDPAADAYVISLRPIGSEAYAPFRFVSAGQAGQVAITDLDLANSYAVSLAALTANGRMSLFSPEVLWQP
jgi:hypothetical protein